MHRLPLVALVAVLFFVGHSHAFNWSLYLPAITGCDSYPFPSCRARTLCGEEGKYWYNGRCNQAKHPDYDALAKLDGSWDVTFHFKNACGGDVWFWINQLHLDKNFIGDDNVLIVPREGAAMSISLPIPYKLGCPQNPNYSRYAIVGPAPYAYTFMEINLGWGVYSGYCELPDGTRIHERWVIDSCDTAIYSFNLTSPISIAGRACFVDADVCLDFTGDLAR